MTGAVDLRSNASKERVGCVTRVAGAIAGNPVVLEVRRRDVARIVDEQTPAVIGHDMAG